MKVKRNIRKKKLGNTKTGENETSSFLVCKITSEVNLTSYFKDPKNVSHLYGIKACHQQFSIKMKDWFLFSACCPFRLLHSYHINGTFTENRLNKISGSRRQFNMFWIILSVACNLKATPFESRGLVMT